MGTGRAKKSFYNMASGFMYHTLTLILSFVSRTVFIYALGEEYLGLNGIFDNVLKLLSMADLGFGSAMAYSFYKPLAENDEEKIASLIAFYKKIYNYIAVAVTILGVLVIPFLDKIVNTEQEISNLEILYIISLSNVVLSYLFVYKTTLMTADQKDYEIVKTRMWTTLLKTVVQVFVLYFYKNYILYLVIGVVFQFINNFIASKKTEKAYPYIMNNNSSKIDDSVKNDIVGNIKSVFIYKLSGTLFDATDNLIISIIVGTAIVGVYSNYLMISSKLLLIEQIVFTGLVASIGNVIASDKSEKRLKIFKAMQSASYIFCGIITTVYCVMVNDVIYVWLGERFVVSWVTVMAITVNTYFACVLQPLWIYRDATGLYRKTKYVMLAGAILNIVLSVILGKIIGLPGIIFASAISRMSTYFWYEPKVLYKEYFESSAKEYYISLGKNLILMIVVIASLLKISSYVSITSWIQLLIKGIIIGFISLVIFLATYSKTEGFQIIYNKVKSIVRK